MSFCNVLAPLVDYVVTGDCWEDYDVQKQFDAYVTKKKAAKEEACTPTLASAGESIFGDSNTVLYCLPCGFRLFRFLLLLGDDEVRALQMFLARHLL